MDRSRRSSMFSSVVWAAPGESDATVMGLASWPSEPRVAVASSSAAAGCGGGGDDDNDDDHRPWSAETASLVAVS